jgi:hypothetical protein
VKPLWVRSVLLPLLIIAGLVTSQFVQPALATPLLAMPAAGEMADMPGMKGMGDMPCEKAVPGCDQPCAMTAICVAMSVAWLPADGSVAWAPASFALRFDEPATPVLTGRELRPPPPPPRF